MIGVDEALAVDKDRVLILDYAVGRQPAIAL